MDFLSTLETSSSTDGSGNSIPSIFEVYGVEKLKQVLFPAFRYLLANTAQRYPRYFILKLYQHHRKIYPILMGLVEASTLYEWKSSITEHFYGLTRESVNQNKNGSNLSRKQIAMSLFSLTCLPVMDSILSEWHEKLNSQRIHYGADVETRDSGYRQKLTRIFKRMFIKLYPILRNTYGIVVFAFQMAFMHEFTYYTDPWLWLSGLKLRRLNLNDYQSHDQRMQSLEVASEQALRTAAGLPLVQEYIKRLSRRFLGFAKSLFPFLIFVYKFLDWWHTSEIGKNAERLPIPPPPAPLDPHPEGKSLPQDPSLCPLCLSPRKNDALIPSGHVFCYTCIFRYVKEEGFCPVTRMRCTTGQIRKLYLS